MRDARRQHVAAEFVDQNRRVVARLADHLRHQCGDAAFALQHVVERGIVATGTVLPVTRTERVNDARVGFRDSGVVDAEPAGRARTHAVHEDVGIFHQPQQGVMCFGTLQIERDAALVAVHVHVHRRHPRMTIRSGVAVRVALRRLDLDHVRAHVAQDLRRDRTEHVDGQIDDPDASQWSRSRWMRFAASLHGRQTGFSLRRLSMRNGV